MSDGARPWDLLVIGGGTAGLVGAHTAARLGARVALVEQHRTGGECLWTGCVPSKALLAVARTVHTLRSDHGFARAEGVSVDGPAVMERVREAIRAIEPHDSPEALAEAGVTVLTGRARFTGPDVVDVDGVRHPFRHALLATGAAPVLPAVPGLAEADPLTTETLWAQPEPPDRLAVLGGGAAGCELAQGLARLGSRVTLVEQADRLLPAADPDASAVLHRALTADGVRVLTGTRVDAVEPAPDGHRLRLVTPGGPDAGPDSPPVGGADPVVDVVLVTAGTRPRTEDLGLAAAGIETDADGAVRVDRRLRTANPRVVAAGDVTALPRLTSVAGYLAGVAVTGALLGVGLRGDLRAVPHVVFTDPEVAWVGEPGRRPAAHRTVTVRHDRVDRAITDGHPDGFTRLHADRLGRLRAATVVGPSAGETAGELALAVRTRTGLTTLAGVVHPYPTYGFAVWDAAVALTERWATGVGAERLTRRWIAVRARRDHGSR